MAASFLGTKYYKRESVVIILKNKIKAIKSGDQGSCLTQTHASNSLL